MPYRTREYVYLSSSTWHHRHSTSCPTRSSTSRTTYALRICVRFPATVHRSAPFRRNHTYRRCTVPLVSCSPPFGPSHILPLADAIVLCTENGQLRLCAGLDIKLAWHGDDLVEVENRFCTMDELENFSRVALGYRKRVVNPVRHKFVSFCPSISAGRFVVLWCFSFSAVDWFHAPGFPLPFTIPSLDLPTTSGIVCIRYFAKSID